MNRRTWLTISLVALFGVGTPVCLYACAETDSSATLAAGERGPDDGAPCHGSGAPDSEQPPAGQPECECEGAQLASTPDAAKLPSAFAQIEGAALASAPTHIPVPAARDSDPRRRQRELPPPDLLLLTSTLLI